MLRIGRSLVPGRTLSLAKELDCLISELELRRVSLVTSTNKAQSQAEPAVGLCLIAFDVPLFARGTSA